MVTMISTLKTKIKIYTDSTTTNFHNEEIPGQKAPCKCLSVIMIVSVIKALSSNTFRRM